MSFFADRITRRTMARLVLSHDAYCHLFLHACKHPMKAVNGLLLGTATKDAGVTVTQALPLFHSSFALAPMLEVALMLVSRSRQSCAIGAD